MDRIHNILNNVQNNIAESAQKTYDGKKRSELGNSDFLFPETKSFPIVSPTDVKDAISNFGRMKSTMSYDAFLRKLYNFCKRKGPAFVAALPEASKEKLGIEKNKANYFMEMNKFAIGDIVKNINPNCKHYGSVGPVTDIEQLPDDAGDLIVYRTVNAGDNWMVGQTLKKTEIQLVKANLVTKDNTMMQSMPNREPSMVMDQEYTSDVISEEIENETPEIEMNEYKQEFLEMSISSIRAIAKHAASIIEHLDLPFVKENLTESWLQGRIAITEDYMRTVHDFVMFSESDDDTLSAGSKPGLWDNIRKKKEREGKNYKPAKPGDKDRPDPEQWKKLTK